jgi:hypothetical protein
MRLAAAGAGLALLVALQGCASTDRSLALSVQTVTPIAVGEAADVSADVLAEALLRAGFTPQEILDHGTDVHHALATSGGVQVRQGQLVEALLAVHTGKLYVTSRTRGTFVLPLDTVAVVAAPPPVVVEPPPVVVAPPPPVPPAPDLIAKPPAIVVKP